MGLKECTKCKIEKDLSEFQKDKTKKNGLSCRCKICKSKDNKIYRINNKEKIAKRNKLWYINNEEKISERNKLYRINNKEKISERNKLYRISNKEVISERNKLWRKNNREVINKNIRRYKAMRYKTDPMYKLKKLLRDRSQKAFKNKGYSKNTKTQEMLGVDWEICKAHIERQFTKGMSWENQGEWHIDHIIPLSSANTPERLKQLCHYTNLQPLWAIDNLSKSDSINGQQTMIRI